MSHEPKFLRADCGVRYWEDATVNGVEDEDGSLIPCRSGDGWMPVIELATGRIVAWPEGTSADIHYKVCDAGRAALLDGELNQICQIDGYVPKIMCPGDNGYGDYVIMTVGPDGRIKDWRPDLDAFHQALKDAA